MVNKAGIMLTVPRCQPGCGLGADGDINMKGLLYVIKAALPHLVREAADGPRRVADVVTISSIAGRVAIPGAGVYARPSSG